MKIVNMNRGDWGNIKAYFTLVTGEGLAINGMRVIEGVNGLFVGFPSKQNEDGEYDSIVKPLDRNVSKAINEEAVSVFENKTVETKSPEKEETFDEDILF